MWYFQNNKPKQNDSYEPKRNNKNEPQSHEPKRNNTPEPKTYHDDVKKPTQPTPEKRMYDYAPKMAEPTQPTPPENPMSRGTNVEDEIEKAMRDVKPEAKMPDMG